MCHEKLDLDVLSTKYKLEPPDGGWGYVIMVSVSIYHMIVSLSTISFGLIYGKFLASIGDETSQTGLASGIYFTLHMFSGCITNFLLRKYSYRKVGLIGSLIYVVGAVGMIFIQNFIHLIICFCILEGVGAGFMIGAVYCSLNSYFHKRLNLMMGIVQVTNAAGIMVVPYIAAFFMKQLGFRKTLIAVIGLSLLNVLNMAMLIPVKRHMKKTYIDEGRKSHQERDYVNDLKEQDIALLEKDIRRPEVIKFQETSNTSGGNDSIATEKNISFIDVDLLKSPKFWNITFGCSLSLLADITFCSLIPALLGTIGFETSDIAFMMTISFSCDLVSRILFAIFCKFFQPKIRYIFFIGVATMAIFRTVFVLHNSYVWRLVTLVIIGFIRCLVTSTYILVLSEEYKETFPSALSLCMVNSGFTSLIYGGLGSIIKTATGSNEMVVHLLTAGNLLCIFCWSAEFIYIRFKSKSNTKLQD